MIPYAYIVAYESDPEQHAKDGKVYLAFEFVYVMASSDEDAYSAGHARMKALGGPPKHAYNDFVVPMGQR